MALVLPLINSWKPCLVPAHNMQQWLFSGISPISAYSYFLVVLLQLIKMSLNLARI